MSTQPRRESTQIKRDTGYESEIENNIESKLISYRN